MITTNPMQHSKRFFFPKPLKYRIQCSSGETIAQSADEPLGPLRLAAGARLYLDFGRKIFGRLHLRVSAPKGARFFGYAYPHPDAEMAMEFSSRNFKNPDFPLSWGTLICPPLEIQLSSGTHKWTDHHTRAFRYLRIDAQDPADLLELEVEESVWPGEREGEFDCSDSEVTGAWEMGRRTLELCTQPALYSQQSIGAPDQWVIWDGSRRDREIWIGDLRPSALAHYALSSDAGPVRNSLELAAARVFENGLIPGSVSSRQIFNEYALWWVVALWEYVLYTGDLAFAQQMQPVLIGLMNWVEKHVGPSGGLFEVGNSWSYTLPRKGLLAGPNIVLCAAYRAMAALMEICGGDAHRYRDLAHSQHQRVLKKFYDSQSHIFRDRPEDLSDKRVWEDNNALAILLEVAPPEDCLIILSQLKEKLWGEHGAATCAPVFPPGELGDICPWAHNGTIWPFVNAYEVGAWMKWGRVTEALDLLKRYTRACACAGTDTIWEMIGPDGSIPKSPDGRSLLSLCHAWGATANHYLHHYVLGVRPVAPGWREVILAPNLGDLQWASGTIPTPLGPLQIEISRTGQKLHKRVLKAPSGINIRGM